MALPQPPRFLIVDDGWQQIENKDKDSGVVVQEGAQFASRLTGIKENKKFQKNDHNNEQVSGLKHVVDEAKQHHNVKFVYVWLALAGYWGGVKPAATSMEHYDTALAYPMSSPGVEGNQPDIVMDNLTVHGLGLVDVQNIIETLGSGHGGKVSLTRSYHQALEASVARNFADNGCISCMCHNTDGLYSAKQTAVVRASDDFYPQDPASHTIHISSVAYNTLFLGEFMQPDWDMFHSLHPAAEYHGAARALGRCAIYVSDKPGHHNFDLLRKLVLPDGSVLRAKLPSRPIRDCLFADPARDMTSLLKIWNVKNLSGVVGVFNCQGVGWCKIEKKTRIHDYSPGTLNGSVRAADVDAIAQVAGADWNGEIVVYAHKSGEVLRLPKGASVSVTLKVLDYEVFHFCPLKEITSDVSFAPIGLLDMFNSSADVEEVEIHLASDKKPELSNGEVSENRSPTATIGLKTRGCGRFGAYCSRRPLKCTVDNAETNFPNYQKGEASCSTLADDIFNVDGDNWKFQRQVSSHEFNTKSLRKFVKQVVDTELSDCLIPILSTSVANNSVLDFQDILQRFAFDNICRITFGYDPDYLMPSLPEAKFAVAFDDAVQISSERFRLPHRVWKLKRALKIRSEKRLRAVVSKVCEFTNTIVR
ncbi:hypothetical protein C1H46_006864 [Malus baccata]|uniref:Galactinol--sucrose galactosyltransferase n=1 Tax=Malus baccata TaxID=106549 RepID=A0A540N913_MALBA|nr:hypothetical protein C1H46_006864 [Malus baccata]